MRPFADGLFFLEIRSFFLKSCLPALLETGYDAHEDISGRRESMFPRWRRGRFLACQERGRGTRKHSPWVAVRYLARQELGGARLLVVAAR